MHARLLLIVAVGTAGRCTEAATVTLEQWKNPHCRGSPDQSTTKEVDSSGDCVANDRSSDPFMAYSKLKCSWDGDSVSLPQYSDANCEHETDMNAHMQALTGLQLGSAVSVHFPPHMTFQNGECTTVLSSPLVPSVGLSWKITAKDCGFGAGAIFGLIILGCCCCGCLGAGAMMMKKKQNQQQAQQTSMYTQPATGMPA